ncbi:hypothetical protein Tco_0528599 [Tanacetum coccineum]
MRFLILESMMLDRFTQNIVDPLALMSNASHQQYYSQSSTTSPSSYVPPHFADNSQLDWGLSPMDNLIENLTNILALLIQSYKTYLPQTNSQLRTSSNTRNHATVQDDRVVVQNVQELNVVNMISKLMTVIAFDSVVDEALLRRTIIHDNYQDAVCEHHEVHEMHDDVQPNYVVDSHADYMSDSNMIPYDQYAKDNAVPVVQSNV